jgi:phosphatidylinositol alpha-mannosyltransferase
MKIALVSPYDFAYPGGVNTHISYLAQQFSQMGHQARIIGPCSNKETAEKQDVVSIGKVVPFFSNSSTARITFSWWQFPQVKSILEGGKFDVVHFHEPLCPFLPWIAIPLSKSINVGTFHAYYERSLGYWMGKHLLLKQLFQRLDGRIAVSEPAKRFVSRYFPGDYQVIPHGVDIERFSPNVPPIEEFKDGKINILFVGRLEKRKGAGYLLQAFEKVKREVTETRLIMVGPGSKRDDYQKWAAEHGLKDVVFTGYVSDEDLPRYYQTGDIFCAPATGKESFGIILLEAMASGKPIVASNIEGYANVATHQVEALLVPPQDELTLAETILHLISHPEIAREMALRGREKALKLGWRNIAQRTLDYYLSLR